MDTIFGADTDLLHLHRLLAAQFNLDELQTLCFDLKVEYEELAGDTRSAKARELVKHCYRHGRIGDLVALCQSLRPAADWHRPPSAQTSDDLPADWVDPLEKLYRLVKAFNRNRQLPFSNERTRLGDEIVFQMREIAPYLFGKFDVGQWLSSSNAGKRIAAIKYLDWLQDIEFLQNLLAKLYTERLFVQFHILLTLDSLLDQLEDSHETFLKAALLKYSIKGADADCTFWKNRILARLRQESFLKYGGWGLR